MPSTIQLADFCESVPSLMYCARIEPTGSARINSVVRRHAREIARQAGHGAGRSAAEHDRIHAAVHLLEDLRARRRFMRRRIVGIAELVDEIRARRFARDAFGEILVVLGMALGDIRARQHHLRAHRLEIEDLLAAHLVGHHQYQPVTLLLRDQRQPQTGIAGRSFDQDRAGLQFARALRAFDHRQPDAVLDRAARIGAFQFQEQLAAPGIQVLRAHHRGLADQFEDAVDDHRDAGACFRKKRPVT